MLQPVVRPMETASADTVAIMAAIIYASRTSQAAHTPTEKTYVAIAKEAWDLHKAVLGGDEMRRGRAGF